jgi:ribosome-associated protein
MARISLEGFIQVTSQTERSQLGNKEKSIARFYQIIEKALAKPKPRRATKPSKASKEVRLQSKKKLSEKKQNRSNSNVE